MLKEGINALECKLEYIGVELLLKEENGFEQEDDLTNYISKEAVVLLVWQNTNTRGGFELNDARVSIERIINKSKCDIYNFFDQNVKGDVSIITGTVELDEVITLIFEFLKGLETQYGRYRIALDDSGELNFISA